MTFPFPSVPPASAATVTFAAQAVSASDLTTYTFSGHSIGAAAGDRHVIVWVYTQTNSRTINSVTVGGVSATLVAKVDGNNTSEGHGGLYIAAVPAGTTADVVVTFSSTCNNCGIATWAAYGLASATPVDTDTKGGAGGGVTNIVFDALASGSGFAVWGVGSWQGVITFTAGTGTERFDGVIEGGVTHTGADAVTTGASVAQTISGSGSSGKIGVAATFA